MEEQKNGLNILQNLGWISVLLAIGVYPPILMANAISIGVVLRRDYQEKRQGKYMIFSGVTTGTIGLIMGVYFNLN
ncbi:hypothetical protein H0266_02440 [Halobacillus locisalis]|uniref:DUF4190 domain-containing protein n=1 Tax=Halobacillus locisalis TaxID=220753 RepID=A0A838CPH6_9BACI|nr:hypothetical protein [Halobacillus locisalis]MBA2173749.1 hypothetical protein [Halobacillus locisalis]